MSYYVEVMCDIRKTWPATPEYRGKLHNRCHSDCGENPQGTTFANARAKAKELGWSFSGGIACCPSCARIMPGEEGARHG